MESSWIFFQFYEVITWDELVRFAKILLSGSNSHKTLREITREKQPCPVCQTETEIPTSQAGNFLCGWFSAPSRAELLSKVHAETKYNFFYISN